MFEFKIGKLIGYRSWTVGHSHIGGWLNHISWPLEVTEAVHDCWGKSRCPLYKQSAPQEVEGCSDLFAPISIDGWHGCFYLSHILRRWDEDLIGRVEAWGRMVVGPMGFRSQFMRPTHLATYNSRYKFIPITDSGLTLINDFAYHWGAILLPSYKDLIDIAKGENLFEPINQEQ